MNKTTILILITSILCIGLSALTVSRDHFGYRDGAQRNFRQGGWNASATDTSEGSGKTWTFILPVSNWTNNSYQHLSSIPGFPGANISCYYDQQQNGYGSSGYIYYQDTGEDILTVGYSGAPNTIWNPPIPTGLPHYLGKTWQGNHAYTYGSYNISGEVISEGIINTHLGSFDALCVRYLYSTTNLSYYCYQWETLEYGIIAYALTLNGGMLFVLHQAEPNAVEAFDSSVSAMPSLRIYPNPSFGEISLDFDQKNASDVELFIFNLRGQIVYKRDYGVLPAGRQTLAADLHAPGSTKLSPGLYLYRVRHGNSSSSGRLSIAAGIKYLPKMRD